MLAYSELLCSKETYLIFFLTRLPNCGGTLFSGICVIPWNTVGKFRIRCCGSLRNYKEKLGTICLLYLCYSYQGWGSFIFFSFSSLSHKINFALYGWWKKNIKYCSLPFIRDSLWNSPNAEWFSDYFISLNSVTLNAKKNRDYHGLRWLEEVLQNKWNFI